MGISTSKSPLERRNTVARRSQRRTLHTIKGKVDKASQAARKFKGVEEDENYNALKSELEHLKNELMRRSRDLQPQIRNLYTSTMKTVEEAGTTLDTKLQENQEKHRQKQQQLEEKAAKQNEKNKEKEEPVEADNQNVKENEDTEADTLAESADKRHTVELKFVKIVTPEDQVIQAEVHNGEPPRRVQSPEEKRKSILKVGVPVMPGAMMEEITSRSKKISIQYHHQYSNENSDNSVTKVNDIIENLQAIECQIADFVGKKNGTQYNRIRDKLNEYLIELNQINTSDEFIIEQIKLCRNYAGSCINFLDEKAVEDKGYDSQDDVFVSEPNNNNHHILDPVEAEVKLKRLTKTTAI